MFCFQIVGWAILEIGADFSPQRAIAISVAMAILGMNFLAQGIAIALRGLGRIVLLSTFALASLVTAEAVNAAPSILSFTLALTLLLVGSTAVSSRQASVLANHR